MTTLYTICAHTIFFLFVFGFCFKETLYVSCLSYNILCLLCSQTGFELAEIGLQVLGLNAMPGQHSVVVLSRSFNPQLVEYKDGESIGGLYL